MSSHERLRNPQKLQYKYKILVHHNNIISLQEVERLITEAEKKATAEKEANSRDKIVAAPVKLQLSDEAIRMRAERERKVAAERELLERQLAEEAQRVQEQEESRKRQQQVHAARRDEGRRKRVDQPATAPSGQRRAGDQPATAPPGRGAGACL